MNQRGMNMLKSIFDMQNIKYVISVDDCFSALDLVKMRADLSSEMVKDISKVQSVSCYEEIKSDYEDLAEELELNPGQNVPVNEFVENLTENQLEICLREYNTNSSNYTEQRDGIVRFLEKLKNDGIIEKYLTVDSTAKAERIDVAAEGMVNGAILWLIDRSFSNVSESTDAGLELAKNKATSSDNSTNYIFMMTSLSNESDEATENVYEIEHQLDELLSDSSMEVSSLIYYISKDRVIKGKDNIVAKQIAFGFKRKLCYELMNMYCQALSESSNQVKSLLTDINPRTLNYLLVNKVESNGESYFDFFSRLVKLFEKNKYDEILIEKRSKISEKIEEYRVLGQNFIDEDVSSQEETSNELNTILRQEIYNTYVNKYCREIASGDIFLINEEYFILVTQACDTFLRKNGTRKLENAILLKIENNYKGKYKYKLPCFFENNMDYDNPFVCYQKTCVIPFEMLDLCVLNDNGEACISIECFDSSFNLDCGFTPNYKARLKNIVKKLSLLNTNKIKVEEFFENNCQDDELLAIKDAFNNVICESGALGNFSVIDGYLKYPIKRVCRLDERNTVSLINDYGNSLSRVGIPFDFTKKVKKQ